MIGRADPAGQSALEPAVPPGARLETSATGSESAPEPAPVNTPGGQAPDKAVVAVKPEYGPHANWTLAGLAVSLIGTAGIAAILYIIRFVAGGYAVVSWDGLPMRVIFVLLLGMVGAPLLVSIRYRVPPLLFVIPVVLNGLLYTLFLPYGLPDGRDPVFVYQMSQSFLQYGQWVPGHLVTEQAIIYSYWPAAGVFNAEFSQFTNLSLVVGFTWAQPVFRLLIMPCVIYALTARAFGARSSGLALYLYLAVPSYELNIPTQQDFTLPWFALTLLFLFCLATRKRQNPWDLRIAVAVFSTYAILGHHGSSYITLGWLAALGVLPFILWGFRKNQKPFPRMRPFAPIARYFALFALYAIVVSAAGIHGNLTTIENSVLGFLAAGGPTGKSQHLGQSFPTYQLGWIVASIGLVFLLALLVVRRVYRYERIRFLVTNLVIGLTGAVVALLMLPTGLIVIAERIMEYMGIVLAPAAAWYIVRVMAPPSPKTAPPGGHRLWSRRPFAGLTTAAAVAIAFVIFTGGALVPASTRDAFAPVSGTISDSARYMDENAYSAAIWASTHLNRTNLVWGDRLVYSVYGGFAMMSLHWDSYRVFNGTNLTNTDWTTARAGQYIITDVYMTQISPVFLGPSSDQPGAPLSTAEIGKFQNPAYFEVLYQNSVFTVYEIFVVPP